MTDPAIVRIEIRELVRTALEGQEPDPRVIARRLFPRLEEHHAEELVLWGLVQFVREEIRLARSAPQLPAASGTSRWQRVARDRRPTPDGWKWLLDCTVPDLDALIAQYDASIAGQIVERDWLCELRDEVVASGLTTPRELLVRDAEAA